MSKTITAIKKTAVTQIAIPKVLLDTPNLTLLSRAVIIYEGNKNRPTSNVKTRSQVSGTGKKPWRQKGTGRARHGSMRSPIWSGGGITFGPSSKKNYIRKITSAEYQIALTMLLSLAAQAGKLVSITDMPVFDKTKAAVKWLELLPKAAKKITFIVNDAKKYRAFTNLPRVSLQVENSLQLDTLAHSDLIVINESYLNSLTKPTETKPTAKKGTV